MNKIWVVIMCLAVLCASCNRETPIILSPGPDQTAPTLAFPFASFASVTQFIPFGDTLPNLTLNKGYLVQLSDTNEYVLAASSGIVTSIANDTSGGNFIAVKFNSKSVYSFLYGGITRVRVRVNDNLSGGSILGKVSGNGFAYFELIKNSNEALCPQAYSSPGFNAAINGAISKNNAFHPMDSVVSPCYTQSLPE
jgi:Peptidase family M23